MRHSMKQRNNVLRIATPLDVNDVEDAVRSGKFKFFSEPQRGACRRILHDAIRDLPRRFCYPNLTWSYQQEALRLNYLLTFFDI